MQTRPSALAVLLVGLQQSKHRIARLERCCRAPQGDARESTPTIAPDSSLAVHRRSRCFQATRPVLSRWVATNHQQPGYNLRMPHSPPAPTASLPVISTPDGSNDWHSPLVRQHVRANCRPSPASVPEESRPGFTSPGRSPCWITRWPGRPW
jgi:hypothetical protein